MIPNRRSGVPLAPRRRGRGFRCLLTGHRLVVVLDGPGRAFLLCRRCLMEDSAPVLVAPPAPAERGTAVDVLAAVLAEDWSGYAAARRRLTLAGLEGVAVALLHAHADPPRTLAAVDLAQQMRALDDELREGA